MKGNEEREKTRIGAHGFFRLVAGGRREERWDLDFFCGPHQNRLHTAGIEPIFRSIFLSEQTDATLHMLLWSTTTTVLPFQNKHGTSFRVQL